MNCPFCGINKDRVLDSRESRDGDTVRRRRECLDCGRRFTSYEQIDKIPYLVVKSGGRREEFDRNKLLGGLMRACEKRPISATDLEGIVRRAEGLLQQREDRELPSREIGTLVMRELRALDPVAYVRFASVYRKFEDLGAFVDEVNSLLDEPPTTAPDPPADAD